MLIAGLDLSNTAPGVAVLEATAPRVRPELRYLGSVVGLGTKEAQGTAIAVLERLREVTRFGESFPPLRVVVELPPPTAAHDVKRAKGQAFVGWSLGYLQGLVESPLRLAGSEVRHVEVSTWRAAMVARSSAWGVDATRPDAREIPPADTVDRVRVERSGAGFTLHWRACGHATMGGQYDELHTAVRRGCPMCKTTKPTSAADAQRDRWKALACRLVAAHWPEPYDALVTSVRARARKREQPDHKLSGVADACEAVWIAASEVPW